MHTRRNWLRALSIVALAAISVLAGAAPVRASVIFFTASGVGSGGAEGASALITTGAGVVTVQLTSLQANPTSAGQEVSGVEITLANLNSLGTVSLTSATGTTININGNTGGTISTDPNPINHWGTATSGKTITLATAGTGSKSGSPYDLIIGPPNGSNKYSNANPSITNHQPVIENTGTFILSVPNATSTTIVTSVVFLFGTGPDSALTGTDPPIPEPASLLLFGTSLLALGMLVRRNRRA